MGLKTFKARTSREALQQVRSELGADAVILSNRKVDGNVEITALTNAEFTGITQEHIPEANKQAPNQQPAVTPPPLASAFPPAAAPEPHEIISEIRSMRDMIREQVACLSSSDIRRDPQHTRMFRDLINAGFSPALSRRLLDNLPANADFSRVRKILAHNLRVAKPEEDIVAQGGMYALIGPTGVGKTTTTAKLAARAVVRYGTDKVALVTTDSYRIGAHEQLRIYGKILGVAVHTVRDAEDLRITLSTLKRKHLVLIDTIGMGQRDKRVAAQTEMFNSTGVQRLLLLNATSGGDTLDDVVCMYHGTGVIGCIPTKLDEAVTLGTVLDVAVRHKLILHYVTNGQRVPEDLQEVNLEYLLHRVVAPAPKAAPFDLNATELPAMMADFGRPAARRAYAV